MRKLLIIVLVLIICAAVLGGCANPASSVVSGSPSEGASSPSSTPVPTTPPDVTVAPVSGTDTTDEDMQAVTINGSVYYLNINDTVVADYSEDPPLCVKKEDGSGDQQLGIRGFKFDIIGDFIYVDSNDPDVDENGAQPWSTTRMNLDGSGKSKLEYGSMSKRLIPQGEQKFYFTTLGDCAVYISDFSCENVETLVIALPDKSEIESKLGTDKVMQLGISDISGGYINFDVTVSAADGTVLYSGSYKTTMDGKTTDKLKGEYYKYSADDSD